MRFATPKYAEMERHAPLHSKRTSSTATATTGGGSRVEKASFPSLRKLRQQAAAARYWMRPIEGSTIGGSECSSDVSYPNLRSGRAASARNRQRAGKPTPPPRSTTKSTRTKPVRGEAGGGGARRSDAERGGALRESVDTFVLEERRSFRDAELTTAPPTRAYRRNDDGDAVEHDAQAAVDEQHHLRHQDIDVDILGSDSQHRNGEEGGADDDRAFERITAVPTTSVRRAHAPSMTPGSTRPTAPYTSSHGRLDISSAHGMPAARTHASSRAHAEHNLPIIGDDDAFVFASDVDDYDLDFFEARKRSGRHIESSPPPAYARGSPDVASVAGRDAGAMDGGRVEELNRRLKEAQTRVNGQNRTIRALEDELHLSRRQGDALHAELDHYRDELRHLRAARERLGDNDADDISNDGGAGNRRYAALVSELRSREALAKYQIASLESKVRELKEREQRMSAASPSSSAFARAKEAIRQRDEAVNEVDTLKSRIKHLVASSESSRNACRAAQQRLSEQEQRNESLRARLEKKTERSQRLEGELASANRTIGGLRLRVEKLENDLEDAVRCARNIGDEVAKREAARHADAMREANSRYFQLESKLEKLHDERIRVEATNKRLQARVREVLDANRAMSKYNAEQQRGNSAKRDARVSSLATVRRAKNIRSSEARVFSSASWHDSDRDGSGVRGDSIASPMRSGDENDAEAYSTSDCSFGSRPRASSARSRESHTNMMQKRRQHVEERQTRRTTKTRAHRQQTETLTTNYAALMNRFRRVARHVADDDA